MGVASCDDWVIDMLEMLSSAAESACRLQSRGGQAFSHSGFCALTLNADPISPMSFCKSASDTNPHGRSFEQERQLLTVTITAPRDLVYSDGAQALCRACHLLNVGSTCRLKWVEPLAWFVLSRFCASKGI